MTSTRGAFLKTAEIAANIGIKVQPIIGGGACDGAFASQRENIDMIINYQYPDPVIRRIDLAVIDLPDIFKSNERYLIKLNDSSIY